MVDLQVLLPFAFGVPEDGSLHAQDFLGGDAADLPTPSQPLAAPITCIGPAKRDAQRGLRLGGVLPGWTTTGKLWQNDGQGRASPVTTTFQRTALCGLRNECMLSDGTFRANSRSQGCCRSMVTPRSKRTFSQRIVFFSTRKSVPCRYVDSSSQISSTCSFRKCIRPNWAT